MFKIKTYRLQVIEVTVYRNGRFCFLEMLCMLTAKLLLKTQNYSH